MLELKGENPFKVRAYYNAARAIENFSGNLRQTATEKKFAEIEGIGEKIAEKIAEYRDKFANPFVAASRGYLDEVITPSQTRPKLIAALASLEGKRDKNPPKKHGNIPL